MTRGRRRERAAHQEREYSKQDRLQDFVYEIRLSTVPPGLAFPRWQCVSHGKRIARPFLPLEQSTSSVQNQNEDQDPANGVLVLFLPTRQRRERAVGA